MKLILTLLLLLFSLGGFSQNQISKKDNKTYNYFLDELDDGNIDKAMKLADSTYIAAIEDNNKILEILMLEVLATGNYRRVNISKSSELFLKSHNF